MESFLHTDDDEIRVSNPPRRSPQVTQAVTSPVRSVHPQLQGMDSITSQADFGMRTADFFEDSSGEESLPGIDPDSVAPHIDQVDRRGSGNRKRRTSSTVEPLVSQCESKSGTVDPSSAGYHRLTPSVSKANNEFEGSLFAKPTQSHLNRFPPVFGVPTEEDERVQDRNIRGSTYEDSRLPDTATSFHGSVDELLPNHARMRTPQQTRSPRVAGGRTPRASTYTERPDNRQSAAPSTKIDQTLGAYAIAHEITLHALLRDEDALDRSLQNVALAPRDRNSLLPQPLDPRSPRGRRFSSAPPAKKAVHVIPPPIDTSAPRHSLPADLIRTPYPFPPSSERHIQFQTSSSPPPTAATATSATESILTLSIRRSNPNSTLRLTTLTIPASNDYTAVRGSSLGARERHFRALDFDDAQFFLELRRCYRDLCGPLRFLSARSLKRIAVSGPATKAADSGYGWRSPRVLAQGDTFSEEQILRHYRKPELVRSRYAFVQWAHRLTGAALARVSQTEDNTMNSRDLCARPNTLPTGMTSRTTQGDDSFVTREGASSDLFARPNLSPAFIPSRTTQEDDSTVVHDEGGLFPPRGLFPLRSLFARPNTLPAGQPSRTLPGDDSTVVQGGRGLFVQQEGLEFVVAWSVWRILAALTLVFVLSIAAVLLWTFLGKQTPGSMPSHGGFRDVGDRLATAFLMGIVVLVAGLSGLAGWLGVSWLVM